MDVTILLATSLSLQGSRLVLWLMARLLMCLGRAPNTWQLPVVLVTAFIMALTSADLARAKATAGRSEREGHGNVSRLTGQRLVFLENKLFHKCFTGDAFGHLSGIASAIFVVSPDPSTRPVRSLWVFCRCVHVRQASSTNFT